MKQTMTCKFCKLPVELDIPDDPTAFRTMRGFMGVVVHDACAETAIIDLETKKQSDERAKRLEQWQEECPSLFDQTEIEKLPQRAISLQALDWNLDSCNGRGMILHSNGSGTGKTRTAYLILRRHFVELGKSYFAITHSQFSRQAVQLQFDEDKNASKRWFRRLAGVEVLLMDDLGKSKFTTADGSGSKGEEVLFDLLEARFNQMRPIIFTTNYRGDDLMTRFSKDRGQYILRRLRERCKSIHFGGES